MTRSRTSLVLAIASVTAGCGSDIRMTDDPPGFEATDASSDSTESTPDAPSHPGKVPMFIAQGTLGRTIVSCDDGQTWVGDHSWSSDGDPMMCGIVQDAAVCTGTGMCSYSINSQCVQLDCCNDTPDIPERVAIGDNAIVGAWGHGKPGALRTTTDGLTWTTTATSYAFSVVYGNGRFVAAGNPRTVWSTDGITWTRGGDADWTTGGSPVREIGYADYGTEGRFIAISAGGGLRDILISSDGAVSWWRPSVIPATCAISVGAGGGGILGGDDVLLIVDGKGTACRSLDGGITWTVAPTGLTDIASQGVWTGSEFVFWGENKMITSSDGATWTATPLLPTTQRIGPTARSDQGTFVAIPYVFDAYDRQRFIRSTDGINWTPLPLSSIVQSHAIYRITFGYADPSALCPLPTP
jgi:hypothetical protein